MSMESAWFGEVRSVLAGELGAASWGRLCGLLSAPQAAEGVEEWQAYVGAVLARRWPDALRVAPQAWIAEVLAGGSPAGWPLARVCPLDGLISGDEQLAALVSRGVLDGMVELGLSGCGLVGHGAAEVLMRCGGDMRALRLNDNPLGERLFELMYNSDPVSLESLEISRCQVERETFEQMYLMERLCGLRRLVADGNPLIGPGGGESGEMAKFCCALDALEELSLVGCDVDIGWVRALEWNESFKVMKRLDLSHNAIGDDGVRIIASSASERMTQLRLNHAGIGAAGARLLALASWAGALEVLELDGNELGEEGLAALAQSPYLSEALRRRFM